MFYKGKAVMSQIVYQHVMFRNISFEIHDANTQHSFLYMSGVEVECKILTCYVSPSFSKLGLKIHHIVTFENMTNGS